MQPVDLDHINATCPPQVSLENYQSQLLSDQLLHATRVVLFFSSATMKLKLINKLCYWHELVISFTENRFPSLFSPKLIIPWAQQVEWNVPLQLVGLSCSSSPSFDHTQLLPALKN